MRTTLYAIAVGALIGAIAIAVLFLAVAPAFRNIANIAMDIDNVEEMTIRTLGGVDRVDIRDMRATDVRQVTVDLAGNDGQGDGAAQRLVALALSGGRELGDDRVDGSLHCPRRDGSST